MSRHPARAALFAAFLLPIVLLVNVGSAPLAVGAELRPAVVFDRGTKFDKSFNEGVHNGVERFRRETGIAYAEFEVTHEAQREQALRNFARRGHDPIIAVGFGHAPALTKVAPDYPDTRFSIIDMTVEAPNVQSLVFREHEGSFLVGLLAAMATKTRAVGFLGGMDIPLIRKFACGYEQGVRHVDPGIEVYRNMAGVTPDAWNDPVKGGELARSQFDRGADIIFAAAGNTGLGALQAAADSGRLAIGVDSNQNHLHPGSMLTSMLKRVDRAAYEVFKTALEDTWTPGVRRMGLREGGIDWALDEHNRALITPEMETAANAARDAIIAGEIKVHDYLSDQTCPR